MSMLSKLIKKLLAAFKAKVPSWLLEAADSAVQMAEIYAASEGIKGETKRAKALEFLEKRLEQLGESASEVAMNVAIEMAVNALEQTHKKMAAPAAPNA